MEFFGSKIFHTSTTLRCYAPPSLSFYMGVLGYLAPPIFHNSHIVSAALLFI